jgi:hypothetical protein
MVKHVSRSLLLFLGLIMFSQAQSPSCNKKSMDSLRWIDGASLAIRGRAFSDGLYSTYTRLPLAAKGVVRDVVCKSTTF